MKPGDLVRVRWVNQPGDLLYKIPDVLGICFDPQPIICQDRLDSYAGIQIIDQTGKIIVYPLQRWAFQVVQ